MNKLLVVIVALVALVFGVTFTIKNPQVVELSYYFGIHWMGPLSWLVIIVFSLGLLAGIVVSLILSFRKKLFSNTRSSKTQES